MRTNYRHEQLVQSLRQLTPNQESIFVVPSGQLMDFLLQAADQTLDGEQSGNNLNLTNMFVMDSDGAYPLQGLLDAQYVIVTEPFFAWSNSEQTTAIKTAFDAFTQNWEFSQDFAPIAQFDLQNGSIAQIYKRLRPTSPDRAARTLHKMQDQVNKPLVRQLDWLELSPSGSFIKKEASTRYSINKIKTVPASTQSFLYLGQLSEQAQISGKAVLRRSKAAKGSTSKRSTASKPSACPTMTLRFLPLNAEGQALHPPAIVQFSKTVPFKTVINSSGASYVLLDVLTPDSEPSASTCWLHLNQMSVTEQT